MASKKDLLMVNPSILHYNAPNDANVGTLYVPEGTLMHTMNPGILSITSYLLDKNKSADIVDLLNQEKLDRLKQQLSVSRYRIIGISCMSGFAYPSTLKIAKAVKTIDPECFVIVGGSHVGPLANKVLQDCPYIDCVCLYEGENTLLALLESSLSEKDLEQIDGICFRDSVGEFHSNTSFPEMLDLNNLKPLRYEVYPDYHSFVPYVEESRGCFAKCNFCIASYTNGGKIRFKDPLAIVEEFKIAKSLYGKQKPYAMLASTFGVRPKHTKELLIKMSYLGIHWNTEFRADTQWKYYCDYIIPSGLNCVNIGVESLSPVQLIRMNKTINPKYYIQNLDELLIWNYRHANLEIKLNFLISIGETFETLRETVGWLISRVDKIASIFFSPLLLFPGTRFYYDFNTLKNEYGCKLINNDYWKDVRLYPCTPSNEFSFADVLDACRHLEKLLNPKEWSKNVLINLKPI